MTESIFTELTIHCETKQSKCCETKLPLQLGQRKQTVDLLPTLCPIALSPKPWANITNYPLVQTLLINGTGRPGLRELTKQTWHGALLYISIPSVFLQGCERLVVWVRSMEACCGALTLQWEARDPSPWFLTCYSMKTWVDVWHISGCDTEIPELLMVSLGSCWWFETLNWFKKKCDPLNWGVTGGMRLWIQHRQLNLPYSELSIM